MSKRRQSARNQQTNQSPEEVEHPQEKSPLGSHLFRTVRKPTKYSQGAANPLSGTAGRTIQQQLTQKKGIFQFQNSQLAEQTSHRINTRQSQVGPQNVVPQFSQQPIGAITNQLPLNYFKPRLVYRLDTFNSIAIQQGQIYNLLEQPSITEKTKKGSRCNCTQSRCKARYCICYSKNQKCTDECGCVGCLNLVITKGEAGTEEFKGCRCQKSSCMKNYCQCHKEGLYCSQLCRCTNCLNIPESHPLYFVDEPKKNKKKRMV